MKPSDHTEMLPEDDAPPRRSVLETPRCSMCGHIHPNTNCDGYAARLKRRASPVAPTEQPSTDGLRFCSSCGNKYPATTEHFEPAKFAKDRSGLHSHCRKCKASRRKDRNQSRGLQGQLWRAIAAIGANETNAARLDSLIQAAQAVKADLEKVTP